MRIDGSKIVYAIVVFNILWTLTLYFSTITSDGTESARENSKQVLISQFREAAPPVELTCSDCSRFLDSSCPTSKKDDGHTIRLPAPKNPTTEDRTVASECPVCDQCEPCTTPDCKPASIVQTVSLVPHSPDGQSLDADFQSPSPSLPALSSTAQHKQLFCTQEQGDSSKLVVLTYASKRAHQFCNFIESAIYNGFESIHVLGWEPLAEERAREYYLGSKLTHSLAFLEQRKFDADTIVLFLDSLDVLLQESTAMIKHKFVASGARFMFSTEMDPWPPSLAGQYGARPAHAVYQYVNSGGWIGYVPEALTWLRRACDNERADFRVHEIKRKGPEDKFEVEISGPFNSTVPSVLRRNDQIIATMLYTEGSLPGATVDSNAMIFQSLQINPRDRVLHLGIDYEKHKLRNRLSGHTSSIIHFNGGAKERNDRDGFDFAQIEPQLWYMQAPVRARCGLEAKTQAAFQRSFRFLDMELAPVGGVSYFDLCGVKDPQTQREY